MNEAVLKSQIFTRDRDEFWNIQTYFFTGTVLWLFDRSSIVILIGKYISIISIYHLHHLSRTFVNIKFYFGNRRRIQYWTCGLYIKYFYVMQIFIVPFPIFFMKFVNIALCFLLTAYKWLFYDLEFRNNKATPPKLKVHSC